MTRFLFSRRPGRIGLCGFLAVLLGGLATSSALAATTPVESSACPAPTLTQPFLSAGDSNWYTLTPGESADSFTGAGWTLAGGAQIQTTQLADGATGSVLDLPSGSSATSPPVCVESDYPTARTMVRDVVGSQGVHTFVSYAGTKTADDPKNTGQVHGSQNAWTLSNPVNVHPGNLPGWQLVQFTLVADGKSSDFQIYDFYVDPRMKSQLTITPASSPAGPSGPTGATCVAAPACTPGPVGASGSSSGTNATGATGPQGANRKVQLVTCISGPRAKTTRRKCTAKLLTSHVTFTTGAQVHETLSRHGRRWATGTVQKANGHERLVLHASLAIPPGRYTLTITSGAGTHAHTTHQTVVIG